MNDRLNFNPNIQTCDAIHDVKALRLSRNGWVERVMQCAVPFLAMYRPTNVACSLSLGAMKTISLLNSAYSNCKSGEIKQGVQHVMQGTGVASLVAFTFFRPHLGLLLSSAYQIGGRLLSIAKGEGEGSAKETVLLAKDFVYLASLFCSRSEVLFLSLALQAASELNESRHELVRGRYLEAMTHFALALIRARVAFPHAGRARRDWFGRDVTQEELDQILDEMQTYRLDAKHGKVDFDQILSKRNLRGKLENLSLSPNKSLRSVEFKNLSIKNCNFWHADLRYSTFAHSTVTGSNFSKADLSGSTFYNTQVKDSKFSSTIFSGSQIINSRFENSLFSEMLCIGAQFQQVVFKNCRLPGANFFRSRSWNSQFVDSDLTDTYLFGAKSGFTIQGGKAPHSTRPVVGFLSYHNKLTYFNHLEKQGLEEAGAAVVQLPHDLEEIDVVALHDEVQQGLRRLSGDPGDAPSLVQALVQGAPDESQIGRIREVVRETSLECHGFFMPGGKDIEPELYGQARHPATHTADNYRRSLIEAALYALARDRQIPLWGVCRGAQAIGVSAGAQLDQDVPKQSRVWQDLRPDLDASPDILSRLDEVVGTKEGLLGASWHHQAITDPPPGFQVLLKHGDVVKLMVDKNMLATQVHPEVSVKWGSSFHQEMPVIIDPKKVPRELLRDDPELFWARRLGLNVERPFSASKYATHRGRNKHIFSYFMHLTTGYYDKQVRGTPLKMA